RLFQTAHAVVTSAAAGVGCGPGDQALIVPRLVDSVLRPLADALANNPAGPDGSTAPADAGTGETADRRQQRAVGPAPPDPAPAPGPAPGAGSRPGGRGPHRRARARGGPGRGGWLPAAARRGRRRAAGPGGRARPTRPGSLAPRSAVAAAVGAANGGPGGAER